MLAGRDTDGGALVERGGREFGSLHEAGELGPGELRRHGEERGEGREAAVGAGENAFLSDDRGEAGVTRIFSENSAIFR